MADSPSILDLAKQAGDLNDTAVKMTRAFANRHQVSEFEAALECNVLTERRLAELIAAHLERDVWYEAEPSVDSTGLDILSKVPYEVARRCQCLPLRMDQEGRLVCLMVNPLDTGKVAEVERFADSKLWPIVTELTKVETLIGETYPSDQQVPRF